jgi:hypothetical protein
MWKVHPMENSSFLAPTPWSPQVGYKHSMDTLTTKVEINPYYHNVLIVNICKFFMGIR